MMEIKWLFIFIALMMLMMVVGVNVENYIETLHECP